MSALAGWLGSGAGFVAVAAGFLILAHLGRLPLPAAHPWIRRGVIVLMYAGGSAIAVTRLGQYARTALLWIAGLFGGVSYGPAHVAIVVGSLFLIAGTLTGLMFAPDEAVATVAIAVPLVLSLVAGGVIHQLYVATTVPAQGFAGALNSWLAG